MLPVIPSDPGFGTLAGLSRDGHSRLGRDSLASIRMRVACKNDDQRAKFENGNELLGEWKNSEEINLPWQLREEKKERPASSPGKREKESFGRERT